MIFLLLKQAYMQSFRTELENPVVDREIVELDRKIREFRQGTIPEEKFRSLRLARGVYGQRQKGVQMVRIKLPYGKMTFQQWRRIAEISDEFSTGNLHLTTRQDIQIHFVSLDRTPELWTKLAQDDITIREACGNTVRNVTGSAIAGIDPDEPFDVTPYAQATFEYFLRNPICQDMGRKFKIAFSSSEKDTAWSFIHDIGVIPKLRKQDGIPQRGFKILVGGGLGAQPYLAQEAFDFLPEDQLIPYIESVLRVFDRYGERTSRHKARMKYLLAKLGLDEFTRLVQAERLCLKFQGYPIEAREALPALPVPALPPLELKPKDQARFEAWKRTNTFEQKQAGYVAAYIRVPLGNIGSVVSRTLIERLGPLVADDVRITPNQGLLLKFIPSEHLGYVYAVLDEEGFAAPGFDSVADITSCPGTDTCNLAISSSTGISAALEDVIQQEFPSLIYNKDIKIKISGCMNSCGQHGLANIGFHGSSIRVGKKVLPALQVLLGGGSLGDGKGRMADKIIKIPSKKGPDALRLLLQDYFLNAQESERFNDYYDRQGDKYFYALLKPVTEADQLQDEDFVDWGQDGTFTPAIGVGECASVVIDLIATLLFDAEEKLSVASELLDQAQHADSIYQSYTAFIYVAKALLLERDVACNTHIGILQDFDKHYAGSELCRFAEGSFKGHVLRMDQQAPDEAFAREYLKEALQFLAKARTYRNEQVAQA